MIPDVSNSARNESLLTWYSEHARRLPWRDVEDPYATLVSEVMLQQTQVDRVIPKFEHFLDRWPTIEDLAQADPTDVVAAWSGLGYNARAIRLAEAARIVVKSGWPTTPEGLQSLPGVGPYTASAIASMAFDHGVPAVDTNVRRVLSRWLGTALDGQELRRAATDLLGRPAGEWNQAIMDLGATICRPRNPVCEECPVNEWCGDPAIYDAPAKQGRFKGSNRELRGALVRAHVQGADIWDTGRALGRTDEEIATALETLNREGLISESEAPGKR